MYNTENRPEPHRTNAIETAQHRVHHIKLRCQKTLDRLRNGPFHL